MTHFDLANNYGEVPGAAEINFGRILKSSLRKYRDELVISSKAGYRMYEGPYGDGGSKKYLINSLNQSLKRLNTDYLDIFYHHRPDLETPLEETMEALSYMVESGKVLYVGLSNYNYESLVKAQGILNGLGKRCIIHQIRYNILNRDAESNNLFNLNHLGSDSIAYCPLAQGLLSDRYINGIPPGSRASLFNYPDLNPDYIEKYLIKIKQLNEIAKQRNQTLAQMSISWCLRIKNIASVIIGVSQIKQLEENLKAVENLTFSNYYENLIDKVINS